MNFDIKHLTKLNVKRDEILAIELPNYYTMQQRERFETFVARKFPLLNFMAYVGEMKFKAIKLEGSSNETNYRNEPNA